MQGLSRRTDSATWKRKAFLAVQRLQLYRDYRYGDLDDDSPRRQRISDGNKTELENSAWLRRRLPNNERRRQFMKWLERRHDNRDGPHLHESPSSRELENSVRDFEAENP